MAANTAAGFDFLVQALKANKGASYGDLKARAEQKGLTVYPVMFGRAKAMLGLVKTAKRGQGKARVNAAKRAARGHSAGGGESKSERIRSMLGSGMSASEIAKKVGCSVNLVYNVKSAGGGRRTPARGRRGRVAAPGANGVQSAVAALQEQAREHERLVRAIERIRAVLAEV